MDSQQTVAIRFPELALSEAGQAARLLREQILDEAPEVEVGVQKDDTKTQDFGATLVLVLGTPAVVSLARGIAKWMMRERTVLEIEKDGEKVTIRAHGTLNENAARIVEALSKQ
jgi:hypothetical protein